MNKKLFTRFLCGLLTVLTLVAVVPAFAIPVAAAEEEQEKIDYTTVVYGTPEERLATMTKYYENDEYALYVDEVKDNSTVKTLGVVAYQKKSTGEVLFTNPYALDLDADASERANMLSQVILTYGGSNGTGTLNSYTHAALKGQITPKYIKNGVRIEYAIGDRSARILVPQYIEKTAFETKILEPLAANIPGGKGSRDYQKFINYFIEMFYTDPTLSEAKREGIANNYPETKNKNIDIYVCDSKATTKELRDLEALILAYCPTYNFEQLDIDHDYAGYVETALSPAVFRVAIEYTIEDDGLVASLSGNGLRFDETVYRVDDFQVLPYMGASLRSSEGYTFLPDGSGSLYDLGTVLTGGLSTKVYGDDYALLDELYTYQTEVARMPVFGQVETLHYDEEGKIISKEEYDPAKHTKKDRGFFAVIEKGESLATVTANHENYRAYASVVPSFVTRQKDYNDRAGWSVYAKSRYVDTYQIRYMILSDDNAAKEAGLSKYYECSWMGMACAYRDYLEKHNENFKRLSDEEVDADSMPLYIETFGCVDTVKKVMSMPVTVSVGLTTFEDVGTMYDYLAGNGVTNVNFKLKGYANGGMYSEVPYKLKWESSVGGASDFRDLLEKAVEEGFGVYPDFDFVYTTQADGGNKVNMKKHATRTIDNRYTTKRVYSATYQSLVSHFQMVMSPVTYSHFYEKLEKRYGRFDAEGISLASFGNSLNSDFDEEKTALREDSKTYVIEALSYFKNKDYSIMLEGGNAFTWNYADHILNVPMDSSRYIKEKTAVPFAGVVLHGYVEFAGSAFNMEGNLSYAMLKAMENGAAAYFVLSYANTELLKEDELLSQNYSVRYDIWQQRLVEIYKELNAVLVDVQTKIIIDHKNLNDVSKRVPDENELWKDIANDAKEKAEAIANKIETERLEKLHALRTASDTVASAAGKIDEHKIAMAQGFYAGANDTDSMLAQLKLGVNGSALLKAWAAWRQDKASTAKADALTRSLNTYVVRAYSNILTRMQNAENDLVSAKEAYELLKADLAASPAHEQAQKAQVVSAAKVDLEAAINSYVALMDAYWSRTVTLNTTVCDTYVNSAATEIPADLLTFAGTEISVAGTDLEAFIFDHANVSGYDNIGMKALYDAYVALLTKDGFTVPAAPEGGSGNNPGNKPQQTPEVEQAADKYAVDNNVVCVTFGDDLDSPYKSLLLNFNDYTIQTVYNGVRYTIEAYGYVVIMH